MTFAQLSHRLFVEIYLEVPACARPVLFQRTETSFPGLSGGGFTPDWLRRGCNENTPTPGLGLK